VLSITLYSSGDVFYLEAEPMVSDALPDHEAIVTLHRPESALEGDLTVTIESLDAEVAVAADSITFPSGTTSIQLPIRALRPGSANFRVSADRFGDVTFTLNVFDRPDHVSATVSPLELRLRLGKGESSTNRVSIQFPLDSIPDKVDLALTADGRPSFAGTVERLAAAIPDIVTRLKAAYPAVSFSIAVSKFQDYGGLAQSFVREGPAVPNGDQIRPFILLLPTTLVDSAGANAAIQGALRTTLPGGNAATTYASYLEALGQIAQGAGFDGNSNNSTLDSGPAGVPGSATSLGYLFPGGSGDVPTYSSKPATVPSAGTLGGVGFRTGAQKIVLLATNTYPVAPVDRAKPFPETITGARGVQVGSFVFQEVNTYPLPGTYQNPRFGPVSSSTSVADPLNAVAPKGAVTVPEVFKTLADQNVQVVSFFQVTEDSLGRGLIDPRPILQNIARLTGAFDKDRIPLVFELIPSTAAEVAATIVDAIRPILTSPRSVSLRTLGNDAGFGFTYTPPSVNVAPGGTAEFTTTITGTGAAGSFEIQFVSEDGLVVGRVPVTITVEPPPGVNPPTISAINPNRGPVGTSVTITGTNFSTTASDNQVRFANIAGTVQSATATTIVTSVPAGSVAGPITVTVTVGGQASNAFPFTVLHQINSFTPTSGPVGTTFTIQGTGFAPSIAGNTITFGTTTATITDATNTQIRGTVPNIPPGPYPVRITTNGITTDVGTFTVTVPPPTITAISPTSGPGGTVFTLTGTNFSTVPGENVITFTDRLTNVATTVAVTSATATQLTGTVPVAFVAGVYTVSLTVNNVAATNTVTFTVLPQITAVTPVPAVIGSQVRIVGTGFSATLADNVVTLNGRVVPLDSGSTAAALLVTVPRGTSGANLAVQVTTRSIPSNVFTIALSQVPVVFADCLSGTFERRDRIVITVCGADATGDVTTAILTLRDGEGQTLGSFDNIDVRSLLAGKFDFEFKVPFDNANHFTAAMSVTAQLKDAAGNTSNAVTGKITNPDIRASATARVEVEAAAEEQKY
jgi:hypothetical protein